MVKELDLVLFLEVKALSQNVRHVNKYSSSYYNKPLKLLSLNIIINVYFFFYLPMQTIPVLLKMFDRDSSLYNRVVIISFFPDVVYKVVCLFFLRKKTMGS